MQKNGPVMPDAHIIQRPIHLGLTLGSSLCDCSLECKAEDKETQNSSSHLNY